MFFFRNRSTTGHPDHETLPVLLQIFQGIWVLSLVLNLCHRFCHSFVSGTAPNNSKTLGNYKVKMTSRKNPICYFWSKWIRIPCHIMSYHFMKHPKSSSFFIKAPGHHIHGEVFLLQWSLFAILCLRSWNIVTSVVSPGPIFGSREADKERRKRKEKSLLKWVVFTLFASNLNMFQPSMVDQLYIKLKDKAPRKICATQPQVWLSHQLV